MTVLTNTRLQNAYPGTHDTSNSAFLSAAPAKHTESSDYFLGTTVDQLAAKEMGRETQLASLELAMDLNPLAGVCNNGYACVYQNCLSWSSPTTPLPAEAHPRVVFERLFGEGGNPAARRAALRNRASLLDCSSVTSRGSSNAWAFPIACAWISISTVLGRSSVKSRAPSRRSRTTRRPTSIGR